MDNQEVKKVDVEQINDDRYELIINHAGQTTVVPITREELSQLVTDSVVFLIANA